MYNLSSDFVHLDTEAAQGAAQIDAQDRSFASNMCIRLRKVARLEANDVQGCADFLGYMF